MRNGLWLYDGGDLPVGHYTVVGQVRLTQGHDGAGGRGTDENPAARAEGDLVFGHAMGSISSSW